jgi:hypothetical protein
MISPLEGLPINPKLVCEFFAIFARFEHTLKATPPFCRGPRGRAEPDWTRFREEIGADLTGCNDQEVVGAIRYLVDCPPKMQMFKNNNAVFEEALLDGGNDGERAIEAARRVRNNLFHGGKHVHSKPGRDEKLVRCSLTILQACLNLHEGLGRKFHDW